MLTIYPAVDLKDGCVVRLVQGKFGCSKVYSRDAVVMARRWARQGAAMIHVVDLDGALTGKQKNIAIASDIAARAGVPVQLGGGVRTLQAIKTLLSAGVSRVILGTRAVQDREFLKKAFAKFGPKIIVSVDAAGGKIMVKGWMDSQCGLDALDFAGSLKKIGFNEMIYTDTLRDGTLKGPNFSAIRRLLGGSGLKLIASGGISSLRDIRGLAALESKGVSGIITGKALYEKKFTLREAIEAAKTV